MANQLNYELYNASQHYEKKTSFNWFEKCANVPPKVVIHVHHVDEEGFGGDVLPVFYLFIFFNKENFFPVQVLHLLVHHDRLPRDLLARSLHPAHNPD